MLESRELVDKTFLRGRLGTRSSSTLPSRTPNSWVRESKRRRRLTGDCSAWVPSAHGKESREKKTAMQMPIFGMGDSEKEVIQRGPISIVSCRINERTHTSGTHRQGQKPNSLHIPGRNGSYSIIYISTNRKPTSVNHKDQYI